MTKSTQPPRPRQDQIKTSFKNETITLKISQIIPLKILTKQIRASRRYKKIVTSIKAIRMIELPVVAQDLQSKGQYVLLDGHMRLEALKELGETEVTCLISTDDESFTYNKHINHLSPIQEHRMILKAIERGVPEEKIAEALDLDVKSIVRKKSMLDGLCPEAIELLKDKMVPSAVFFTLKLMCAMRQIEAATLMNDANIYSAPYARALLAATPKSQLTEPHKPKKIKGLNDEKMTRMENEMSTLQREYRLVEEVYSTDVMNLMLAKGYLTHLLSNAKIVRYLAQNYPEFLSQFQKISEVTSLDDKSKS